MIVMSMSINNKLIPKNVGMQRNTDKTSTVNS